jgi:amidase
VSVIGYSSVDLIWSSAETQAKAIRRGDTSAVELVRAHLRHIDSVNPSINAIVQIDAERALARAAEIDDDIARGTIPSPLAGVPFTAKDNIETEGIVTSIGVPERRHTVPDRDATVIYRMKAAGAILLGKTNCPPWGGGLETDNSIYGRTNNPYALECTPGGSSGGEAAAIASGMSAVGLGSDSGGSLRYPAHFCGIATIKPTAGLIPLTGALDDVGQFGALRDPRTQLGPMARSVQDLIMMLQLISGPDKIDASVVPLDLDFRALRPIEGLRVALQQSNGEVSPSAETVEVLEAAGEALTERGAVVVPEELPDEGLALTREIWRSYGGTMPADELYQLLAEWDAYRSRLLGWFQSFDLIVRPVNATPAVRHGETDPSTLYTVPFSLTGCPAAVVRCGTSSDGLPIGLQIVAHPWQDPLSLMVARVLETALGGWHPPAPDEGLKR